MVKNIKVKQNLERTNMGFRRAYKIELTFDSLVVLKTHLGLSAAKMKTIFKDRFVPQLMNEVFKQLKKVDPPTQVQKISTRETETDVE